AYQSSSATASVVLVIAEASPTVAGSGHEGSWISSAATVVRCPDPRMKSAARSAIITTGAFVLQDGMIGITEASAIRKPSTPRTRSDGSTTDCSPLPMAQVPQVWKKVSQA